MNMRAALKALSSHAALVETEADVTPQIRHPQRKHAGGEGDEVGPDEYADYSQHWPLEISAGIARAVARAISAGAGKRVSDG